MKMKQDLAPSTIAKGGAKMRDRMEREPSYATIVLDEPPEILKTDELACSVWRDTVGFLNATKVMTVADVNQLLIYCQTFADWVRDEQTVRLEGRTVCTDRGGMQKHPLLAVIAQNKSFINAFGREFGMTPASRAKVRSAPTEKPKSEFDEV